MTEQMLVRRALDSIKRRAGKRAVAMYGRHVQVQQALEDAGVKIEKIFTGNLELLADKTLNCSPSSELDGASGKYFIIVPFFLENGEGQRNTLKLYGFTENKDYIFFPEEKTDEGSDENNHPSSFYENLLCEAYEKINEIQNQISEIKRMEEVHDAQNKLMLWRAVSKNGEDIDAAKKQFFLSLPKAAGTLRMMQLAGVILLAKLDEVCRANDIPYWISFGTLLGAVRHNGFIPWDDDTDVAMMRADAERLTHIMENDKDFFVSHIFAEFDDNINHCVQLKFRRDGTPYCLDIFIYDYCNDISPENVKRQIALNRHMADEAQTIRKGNLIPQQKNKRYEKLLNEYLERSRKEVGTTDIPGKYMIWALDNYRCDPNIQSNCAISDVFPLKRIKFEGLELNAPANAEEYLREKYGDFYSLPEDMLSHTHFVLDEKLKKILASIISDYSGMLH